jgi:hypothetical protein
VRHDQPDSAVQLAVAVGSFADPDFPPPSFSVYEDRQHGWALAPGQLPLEPMD